MTQKSILGCVSDASFFEGGFGEGFGRFWKDFWWIFGVADPLVDSYFAAVGGVGRIWGGFFKVADHLLTLILLLQGGLEEFLVDF